MRVEGFTCSSLMLEPSALIWSKFAYLVHDLEVYGVRSVMLRFWGLKVEFWACSSVGQPTRSPRFAVKMADNQDIYIYIGSKFWDLVVFQEGSLHVFEALPCDMECRLLRGRADHHALLDVPVWGSGLRVQGLEFSVQGLGAADVAPRSRANP